MLCVAKQFKNNKHILIKGRKKGGLAGSVQINQERRESKEERKKRRHRRVKRRERKKGVDSVVKGDQPGLCNRKHNANEEGK